jgi:hypothetical protein
VQIARAAARLAEGTRNPAVADAIRRREEAARALAALYRERDEATAAGPARAAELAAIDARIAEAQAAASEADLGVQAAAPGYAQLVQAVASAQETLAALAPGEAMAVVALAPRGRGWTFVLRDGAITAGRVGADPAEVEALVGRLRASVESGDTTKPFDAEAAHRLHRAVFAEVEAPLADARRLVVAPSGPLLSIPFGVLAEAPPPAPRGHGGVRFLLARLPVVHVPAPASLVALRRAAPGRRRRPARGSASAIRARCRRPSRRAASRPRPSAAGCSPRCPPSAPRGWNSPPRRS